MALPIDIPTIISSIRLCVEIGQTVLCNKKEVGELVDDLDMVHDILDNLSSEVKERADQHKLYRVSKMLNYVTKKSFQIFNKLQRKKFTDRIRNTVAARAIKEDIQKLSSRLEKVVGYLNLVFNIQSAVIDIVFGVTIFFYFYVFLFLSTDMRKVVQQ